MALVTALRATVCRTGLPTTAGAAQIAARHLHHSATTESNPTGSDHTPQITQLHAIIKAGQQAAQDVLVPHPETLHHTAPELYALTLQQLQSITQGVTVPEQLAQQLVGIQPTTREDLRDRLQFDPLLRRMTQVNTAPFTNAEQVIQAQLQRLFHQPPSFGNAPQLVTHSVIPPHNPTKPVVGLNFLRWSQQTIGGLTLRLLQNFDRLPQDQQDQVRQTQFTILSGPSPKNPSPITTETINTLGQFLQGGLRVAVDWFVSADTRYSNENRTVDPEVDAQLLQEQAVIIKGHFGDAVTRRVYISGSMCAVYPEDHEKQGTTPYTSNTVMIIRTMEDIQHFRLSDTAGLLRLDTLAATLPVILSSVEDPTRDVGYGFHGHLNKGISVVEDVQRVMENQLYLWAKGVTQSDGNGSEGVGNLLKTSSTPHGQESQEVLAIPTPKFERSGNIPTTLQIYLAAATGVPLNGAQTLEELAGYLAHAFIMQTYATPGCTDHVTAHASPELLQTAMDHVNAVLAES